MNAVNAVGTPAPVNPALFDHLEWKAEQILGQLRAGYSLERLSAVYEVPEPHLRDRVPVAAEVPGAGGGARAGQPFRTVTAPLLVRMSSVNLPFGSSGTSMVRLPLEVSAETR